jgi:outer membrane protein OmpA-like peptidoglycan-associated protein
LLTTCLVLLQSSAWGAPTAVGFALNRYQPAEVGSDWFESESLDLRGGVRPALGLVADFSYRPLVILDSDGDEVTPVVDNQFFYHLGASLILQRRLRLSASLPLLLHSQGGAGSLPVEGLGNATLSSRDGAGVGDARFSADLRLAGEYEGAFTLAVGARVFAPLGQEDQFAGDGQARFAGRLLWAGQPGFVSYAGQVGVVGHTERDDFAGVPFGTDLTFGAALGLRLLDGSVTLGPEVYGSTVISDSGEGFMKRASTPLEMLLGGKLHVGKAIRLGGAAGSGLTQGIGSPRLRVLASVEWLPSIEPPPARPAPLPTPRDLDGDGVLDSEDACPREAGPKRPQERARSGCPDPLDSDGDGISDPTDACPRHAGPPSADLARHGCAPLDADADGIVDSADACPDTAGVQYADPQRNGCPADSDGDGILDVADACPGVVGEAHADTQRHGCPKARMEGGEIKISEQVKFKSSSATILPESDGLLDAVTQILLEHPEIELLSVEGHTDNRGSTELNLQLSRARAAAVVNWLVARGVAPERVTSQGYGLERPIDSNETPEGRQNNRRVEFRIVRRKAASGLPSSE